MKRILRTGLAAAALAAVAAASRAAELKELVKDADLVLIGQVISITEGELDTELLKMGAKFRTDVAVLITVEVLKGHPGLRGKRVEVGFPGFPKAGQVQLKQKQNGIWLLTKSDLKFYEVKTARHFLPMEQLGAVRRAVRAAAGLSDKLTSPESRAARAAELAKQLLGKEPPGGRRLAAYRLGELGVLSAVPAFIRALDDKDPSVRFAVDIALRKTTGSRTQVDFENGTAEARAQGIAAWHDWWEANQKKKRKDLLAEAARVSIRPQPDFQYAIQGLAQYGDRELLPLFRRTFDSALSSRNNTLAIAVARYLARVKDRPSVPKLVGVLNAAWPSVPTRAAAATAVGGIVGQDFGTGSAALENCLKWWRANEDKFR